MWQAKEVGTVGDPAKIPLPVDMSITRDGKGLWVNTFHAKEKLGRARAPLEARFEIAALIDPERRWADRTTLKCQPGIEMVVSYPSIANRIFAIDTDRCVTNTRRARR